MRNSKSAKSWTSERAGRSSTISAPGNERSATAASVPWGSSACMDAWSASERATEGAPAQGSYIEDGIPLTMSMGAGEQVRGILPSARLGLTDYDLIVTDRRIVASKIGSSELADAAGGLTGPAVSLKAQDAGRAHYGGTAANKSQTSNKQNIGVPSAADKTGT